MNTSTVKNLLCLAFILVMGSALNAQPFLESVSILNQYEDSYNTGGFYRLEKGQGSQVNYDMNIQWDNNGRILSFQSQFADSTVNDRSFRCTRIENGDQFTYTTEVREPNAGIANFTTQRKEIVYTDGLGNDTMITTTEYDPNFGFPMYSYSLRFTPKIDGISEVQVVVNGSAMATMIMLYNANDLLDSVIEISFTTDPSKLSIYHYSGTQLDSISYYELTIFQNWKLKSRTFMTTGTHGFTTEAYAYTFSDIDNSWTLPETMIFNRGMGISIEEEEHLNEWVMFPNPAGDFVEFSGLTEVSEYQLFSMLGEEVQKGTVANGERISLHNHKAGVYLLSVAGQVKRLIIQ